MSNLPKLPPAAQAGDGSLEGNAQAIFKEMFAESSERIIAELTALKEKYADGTLKADDELPMPEGVSALRLRHADDDVFDSTASKLARFAQDYAQQVKQARPVLPDVLNDRDQDNWECLLAIASCAGDEWLSRATAAALKLSGAAEKTVSTGNELLADIQHVFESKRVDRISTADLIAALVADDENAWAAYNRGKQITPRQVARQLAAYGIASKTIRVGAHETPKGFELSQFADVFVRYLSTPLNLPPHPPQTLEANKHAASTVADNPPQKAIRHNSATPKAPYSLGCGGVADKTPILGDVECEVEL